MPDIVSQLRSSGIVRALRHPTFAIYISAHAISVLGLWIQRIAIQWLVWELSGSYAWLGWMALAEAACATVFSFFGGPIADRFDRSLLAASTQSLLAVIAFALAITTYLGLMQLPMLMAFVVITGAIEGLWTPVRLAIIPNLVPAEDMPPAVALTALIFNLAIFIGPAIGLAIISLFDIEGAFVANAISYLGLVLVFLRIKISKQSARGGKSSYKGDLFAGVRYMFSNPSLRAIIIFGFIFAACMRPYRELLAGIADETFNMGAEGLSALVMASGFGAAIGAFIIASYGRTRALVNVIVTVAFTAILSLLLFAFARSLWFAMLAVAILSLCVTVFGTAAQTVVQMSVADEMRGRVMSLWQAQFRGVPTFAAWLIGLLEPWFGLRTIFMVICLGFLLFMLANLGNRHLLAEFEK